MEEIEVTMDMEISVNTSQPQAYIDVNANSSSWDNSNNTEIADLQMPIPEILITVLVLSVITLVTIVGNILVILSVFTYKPLRIVQNFFIVSLAVADLTVAILVMPLNVVYSILGRWVFGLAICEMWLTCDVLCCTASILNLCAIALDRYWAITDPLNYAQKRTFKRVMLMIILVWAISGIICLPPLIGWNDWPDDFNEKNPCRLTEERGYVIYSSCGSFYIPLLIMTLVYIKIYLATRRRLRERARASKIPIVRNLPKPKPLERSSSFTPSEANHNEDNCADVMCKENGAGHCSADENGHDTQTNQSRDTHDEADINMEEKKLVPSSREDSDKSSKDRSTESKNSRRGASRNKAAPADTITATNIPQFIEERQRISLSKERRAARILGIIMGVFVVCWLPFFLMYVINSFCKTCFSPLAANIITWLGYVNSTLNPVIYTIFNMDFRAAFAKLLKCK